MYKKLLALSCTFFLVSAKRPLQRMETLETDKTVTTEFVILIASYNNEELCEANLASVLCQQSSNPFHVIIVNDCSTDKTAERLRDFVNRNNVTSQVTLINNTTRHGSLKNIYSAIHTHIEDHKVVVSVDGDDELVSTKVLLRLEQEYKNPSIHLTYGSFIQSSTNKRGKAQLIPEDVIKKATVRKLPSFWCHHLKTFRAGLFKRIHKEDMLYGGQFFTATGDLAFMYPMIEMLAHREKKEKNHTAFIQDILYKRNDQNPLNDFRIHKRKQRIFRLYIKRQKPYAPLGATLLETLSKPAPQENQESTTILSRSTHKKPSLTWLERALAGW